MVPAILALCAPLLASAASAVPPAAALPPAAASGYVVRADSAGVYLDLGASAGASVGQPFQVYTEGEELKHPVTGASLGRIENVVADGLITQVAPLYSVGELSKPAQVKIGMRARLGERPVSQPQVQAPPAVQGGVPMRAPRLRGPSFDFMIHGLAVADFSGQGKPQLALASPTGVSLYPYPPTTSKPAAELTIPGVAPRVLSIDAADVNGNGRAELFVAVYNQSMNRLETEVVELDDKGALKIIAELPWLVRALQQPSGEKVIASQQLVDDQTFPFSGVYPVVYKDGKYAQGTPAFKHRRADFLYEFTYATLDEKPAMLYYTSNDHVRVQFDSGYWKTRDAYGQTPVRLRWPQDSAGRLLEFHPLVVAGRPDGKTTSLYAIRNLSMLGSLSEPFGLFNGGEVERLSWNGVALATDWKADLGGYSTALQLVPGTEKPSDLVVAVAGTSGKSSVWIFDP